MSRARRSPTAASCSSPAPASATSRRARRRCAPPAPPAPPACRSSSTSTTGRINGTARPRSRRRCDRCCDRRRSPSGRRRSSRRHRRPTTSRTARPMLLDCGIQALILKRGARGSTVFRRDAPPADVAPFPIEVLNVLGAGDAFASGFLYGYLQGWPLERAARMGNACGAIVVTRHGCANFMPTLDEVTAFVAERGRAGDMTRVARAADDGAGGGAVPVAAALGARRPRAAVLRRRLRHLRPRQRRRHRPGAAGAAGRDALLPRAQRAGDGAHRGRLREDAQPPAHARLHLVDRTRRDQHDHRRGRRDDQPRAGAAAAGRHLRRPRPRAGPAAARVEPVAGRLGQRLLQAGLALLGSDQPAGADRHRAAGSDARADVAGRNRRGDAGAAAGRAGRGVRLPGGAVRAARLDDRARRARIAIGSRRRRR